MWVLGLSLLWLCGGPSAQGWQEIDALSKVKGDVHHRRRHNLYPTGAATPPSIAGRIQSLWWGGQLQFSSAS